jgi:hypothetical protein
VKLRIVSDGTAEGTQVVDETGRVLEGLASVTWQLHPDKTVTATLVVREAAMDLSAEVEEQPVTRVIVCPICGVKLEADASKVKGKAEYQSSGVRWKCGACGKLTHAEDWFDTSEMN